MSLLLAAAAAASLRPELAIFTPLTGKCWRGSVSKTASDTHCFEAVLGGRHLRDTHEVPGTPPYLGETLYSWNEDRKRIDWHYFSSLGWVLRGSVRAIPGSLDFVDEAGKTVARWRWRSEGGYTVINGDAPPVAFDAVAP